MNNELIIQEVFEFDKFFHDQEKQGNILRKSSEISKQLREHGNQLYVQKNHNQDVHKHILQQYSQSIAFAPKDSEELALGFSNRSVLLMHLHYYEKCIIDIGRALEITKSHQLKSKLESRQEKCTLLLMDDIETKTLEELKFDENAPSKGMNVVFPSTKLQSAAESVTLKHSKAYGRYLIANQEIKAGEIVIAEKGYACYPEYNQIYLVCSHCLSFAWNGIPCDSCVFAIYCNETCKNEAWEEYHSTECPLLKFLYFDITVDTKDILLATRIFIKAVKAEGLKNVMNETQLAHDDNDAINKLLSNGVLDSNKFRSCYNLHCRSPNWRLNTNDDFYESLFIYLLIKYTNIMSNEKEQVYNINDENILLHLKNIFIKLRDVIDMNGFTYQWCRCTCKNVNECQKECNTARGVFIAPCSSLINHSCIPNICKFFMPQRKIVFYASRPIKEGEQLCISYGPTVTMDQIPRQNYILQNFQFTCLCIACKESKTLKYCSYNKDADMGVVMKIFSDFQKIYRMDTANPFFTKSPLEWTTFNKKLLEQALKISELTDRHFESYGAFTYSIPYMIYINKAFYTLFGEKCVIPSNC